MLKKEIIEELKKYEAYKKFSDSHFRSKTKATLKEMLLVEKEKQEAVVNNPANVRLENGKIIGLPPDNEYIDNDCMDFAVEQFAKNCGFSKENILKKFEIIEKNSGGKKLSNYDKMLCMGIDFGRFGIYK